MATHWVLSGMAPSPCMGYLTAASALFGGRPRSSFFGGCKTFSYMPERMRELGSERRFR